MRVFVCTTHLELRRSVAEFAKADGWAFPADNSDGPCLGWTRGDILLSVPLPKVGLLREFSGQAGRPELTQWLMTRADGICARGCRECLDDVVACLVLDS